MDNYIVINGKKAELTEEQLKALGIEVSNTSLFRRAKEGEDYWYISSTGKVVRFAEEFSEFDTRCYNIANYCTDKIIMEQRALHEILSRLLWRFSMEHDGDKINWNDYSQQKYYIHFGSNLECGISWDGLCRMGQFIFIQRKLLDRQSKKSLSHLLQSIQTLNGREEACNEENFIMFLYFCLFIFWMWNRR